MKKILHLLLPIFILCSGFGPEIPKKLHDIKLLQFDTAGTNAEGVGIMSWNSDEHTVDIQMGGGVVGQVNHETFYPISINQSGSDIADGIFVMFAGTVGNSGKFLVTPAVTDGSFPVEYMMGVTTEAIANGGEGHVSWFGKVRGIPTDGSAQGEIWVDGATPTILYPNPLSPGDFTNIEPNAPNLNIPIAVVVTAHATNGTIFVRPHLIPTIKSLSDVNGTPVDNTGQILVWDNDNEYFDFNFNVHDSYPFGFITDYAGTQETTLAFDDGNYTLTLAPTGSDWGYYRNGPKHVISGSKTCTLSGSPPAKGFYYAVIDDSNGTITCSTTPWTLEDTKVPVATIAWDNSLTPKYWMANERHSNAITRRFHWEHHFDEGTEVFSAPTLSGYTVTPSSPNDTDNTFGASASVIVDEDLKIIIPELTDPDGNTAVYNGFFRDGVDTWDWTVGEVPYPYSGTYIQYDDNGTLTTGQGNKFYNTYMMLTDIQGDASISFIVGQNEYATLAGAKGESFEGLVKTNLPINEFVAIYQFNWQSSAAYSTKGKVRLAGEPVAIEVSASGGSSAISLDHGALTGLGDDDHPQYLLTDGTRILTGDQDFGGFAVDNADRVLINQTADNDALSIYGFDDVSASYYKTSITDWGWAKLETSAVYDRYIDVDLVNRTTGAASWYYIDLGVVSDEGLWFGDSADYNFKFGSGVFSLNTTNAPGEDVIFSVADGSTNLNLETNRVINAADPVDDQDLATKKYHDDNSGTDPNAIQKDGTVVYVANQPMGGFKLTGLDDGNATGESVAVGQILTDADLKITPLWGGASAENTATYISRISSPSQVHIQTLHGDITTELQAIIDYFEGLFLPVGIHIPDGSYYLTSKIIIKRPNISIYGAGRGDLHDVLGPLGGAEQITAPTEIRWEGSDNGTMIQCLTEAAVDPAETQKISGNKFIGFALVGKNNADTTKAGIGLDVRSVNDGKMELYVKEFRTAGVQFHPIDNADMTGEPNDSQKWDIDLISRQVEADDGYIFYAKRNANANGNFSHNKVNISGQILDSAGVYLEYSDNNLWETVNIIEAGTGLGVELLGGEMFGGGLIYRSSAEIFLQTSSTIKLHGTETYTYPSINNFVLQIDTGNGYPEPIKGIGTSIDSRTDSGVFSLRDVRFGDMSLEGVDNDLIISDKADSDGHVGIETRIEVTPEINKDSGPFGAFGFPIGTYFAPTYNQESADSGGAPAGGQFELTKTDSYDFNGNMRGLRLKVTLGTGGNGSGSHDLTGTMYATDVLAESINTDCDTVAEGGALTLQAFNSTGTVMTEGNALNITDSTSSKIVDHSGVRIAPLAAGSNSNVQLRLENQPTGYAIHSAGGANYLGGTLNLVGNYTSTNGDITLTNGKVDIKDLDVSGQFNSIVIGRYGYSGGGASVDGDLLKFVGTGGQQFTGSGIATTDAASAVSLKHAESHTVLSHSDLSTVTGAELETAFSTGTVQDVSTSGTPVFVSTSPGVLNTYKIGNDSYTGNQTITTGQSGRTIRFARATAGTQQFTLPAIADGLIYTFVANVGANVSCELLGSGDFFLDEAGFGNTKLAIAATSSTFPSITIMSNGSAWFVLSKTGNWVIT